MRALEHSYGYQEASTLARDRGGAHLRLATSEGPSLHPRFFSGKLLQPRATADLLLALGEVVKSRYSIPPSMLQRILREADPVVTCDGERLRFEVFSSCCSVYARVDLLPGALDGPMAGRGTTNVGVLPGPRSPARRLLEGFGEASSREREASLQDLETRLDRAERWHRAGGRGPV